jgi:hypothetical protein
MKEASVCMFDAAGVQDVPIERGEKSLDFTNKEISGG